MCYSITDYILSSQQLQLYHFVIVILIVQDNCMEIVIVIVQQQLHCNWNYNAITKLNTGNCNY